MKLIYVFLIVALILFIGSFLYDRIKGYLYIVKRNREGWRKHD